MKTWKQEKIRSIKNQVGGYIEGYNGYTDDRGVYVAIYNQMEVDHGQNRIYFPYWSGYCC